MKSDSASLNGVRMAIEYDLAVVSESWSSLF